MLPLLGDRRRSIFLPTTKAVVGVLSKRLGKLGQCGSTRKRKTDLRHILKTEVVGLVVIGCMGGAVFTRGGN